MAESLATKYRPHKFEDICGQSSIVKILNNQVESGNIKNCYLFQGPSGCGKTTIARILADKINKGLGTPIEIDGASNNGVDNVRLITDTAMERALDSEYKVYIIDECHAITNAAWQAFLKCIEEPPKYTIFMFCTTDPQKMPETIVNRCQVFSLSKIDSKEIIDRLKYIANKESFILVDEAADYIMRLAGGSMRQAITYLDKCKDFSTNISMETVLQVLGDCSYSTMFKLTNARIDGDKSTILSIIEKLYNSGSDLKVFIDRYMDFTLDLAKYCIFKTTDVLTIPSYYKNDLEYTINIEDNTKFFIAFSDKLLQLKQLIKGDSNIKTTVEIFLINQ